MVNKLLFDRKSSAEPMLLEATPAPEASSEDFHITF